MCAADKGHTEIVKLLLARTDIQLNTADNSGDTALVWAADKGHLEVVRILVSDPRLSLSQRHLTSVHFLLLGQATGGPTAGVRAVVRALNYVQQPDLAHNSRTCYIAMAGWLLRDPGADLAATIEVNFASVLLRFRNFSSSSGFWNFAYDKSKRWCVQDGSGRALLALAAHGGHTELVRQLLAAPGVAADHTDSTDNTALIYACDNGHRAVVELLLAEPSTDCNRVGDHGYTPLICAAADGYTDVVEILLRHPGLQVNHLGGKGRK